ncbi:hypothetical protein SLA2020_370380 [Shorea laevis]
MSTSKAGPRNKKNATESKLLSLQEKKETADQCKEEEALAKEIEELKKWTETVDAMDDEQLKEYLENRPEKFKSVKIQKSKPRPKVQKVLKSRNPAYTGIMASVWKFHKED